MNKKFHVYVLASPSKPDLVKVGMSNNANRVNHLIRMHYGDVKDWQLAKEFFVDSNHAAAAVERMIHARLTNEGYGIPRFPWTNRINSRPSFADECFSCGVEHAIEVAAYMVKIYKRSVA